MKLKKFIVNHSQIISFIVMFIGLILLPIYINIYTRNGFDLGSITFNTPKYYLLWIGFSISWSLIIMLYIYLLKKKNRFKFYAIILVVLNVIFDSQICYSLAMGKFMIFSDLFCAGEGMQYAKAIVWNLNPGMVITNVISIIILVLLSKLDKHNDLKKEREIKKRTIILLVVFIILFRLLSYIGLGRVGESNTWKENYNSKNIYNNYSNPNTSMLISGFYEYTIRSIYKYFYNIVTLDITVYKNNVNTYNNIYSVQRTDNDYTGIIKDKNIIFVMMESMDNWIIDKNTTPNIYMMEKTGYNFRNKYTPFFNGGQTINSEFALNTGMYAISSNKTIYDIDNEYNYSLANTLKKRGYSVNSFHANLGSFYNRSKFHANLGYDHHFSMREMQDANILEKNKNYFSDSVMLSDNQVLDLIIPTDKKFLSFITTYSAHLEYNEYNPVYKVVDKNLNCYNYTEEECVYRRLAYDTDKAIGYLIDNLKKKDLLNDTIIVLATDHYSYGYSDSNYVAAKKNVKNDRKEMQNTPLVIWGASLDNKNIDTIMDTADVLPTLLNMLGIEYDPNNYLGEDVFSSNHDLFVWFSDGTFIKSNDCTLSDDAIYTKASMNILKNKSIILSNYYGD